MVEKIDVDEVKSYVEDVLVDLQDTHNKYGSRVVSGPADVANRFRMEGLKGRCHDTCSCIIARFVRNKMREADMGPKQLNVSYSNDTLIVRIGIQRERIIVEVRGQVAYFIALFDDGEYPDLDVRKSNVEDVTVVADVTKQGEGVGYRYVFKSGDDVERYDVVYDHRIKYARSSHHMTRGDALKEASWLISQGWVRQLYDGRTIMRGDVEGYFQKIL